MAGGWYTAGRVSRGSPLIHSYDSHGNLMVAIDICLSRSTGRAPLGAIDAHV